MLSGRGGGRSSASCSAGRCTRAHLFQRFIRNEWLRAAAGGVLVIALSLLCGTADYNGGGIAVIERVFESGAVRPEAFL